MSEPVQDLAVFKGTVTLTLRGPDGEIKHEETLNNVITATGIAHMANRISGISAPAAMGWLGIGTGISAAAITDALLGVEVARVPLSPTVSLTSTTVTNDTINYQATFGPNVPATPQAITEAGVFGVVTPATGPMLNRLMFSAINKGIADSLSITWKVKVA